MFPVICQIGSFQIYSYGVMMAVAVVVCSVLLSRDARSQGISSEEIYDFVFWIVLSGIIGARIFFVFLNFPFFWEHPTEIIMVQKGGLAWQGSLIVGTAVTLTYIRRKRWPLGKTLDMIAPYAALGQSIGRIGCFFNGCCYGREVFWGIYFPTHMARLHPTQLYDSIGLFLIYLILRKFRGAVTAPGRIFIAYLLFASAQRFIIEFFRADHETVWGGFSIFQWVSLAVFATAFYVNTRLKSRLPR